MKKHAFFTVILMICLLLPMQITAFAAEEQELSFWETVEYTPEQTSLFARSASIEWKSTSDTYYDQLSAEAKGYYDLINHLFEQEAAGQITIPQKTWTVNGKAKTYWSLGVVASETLTGTGDPDAAFEKWCVAQVPAVSQAGSAFVMDCPEYFWIRTDQSTRYGYSGRSNGNSFEITCEISLGYGVQAKLDTIQTRQTLQTQIDTVVDNLIRETKNLKAEQKIAYWDNWLAVNNRYKGAALAANYIDEDATPWCIVGALLADYQPVCEGYAKALQLLCHEAGIPCLQVSGDAGGGHMWTAVKLEDNWYFCDPTWDDPAQDVNSWNYSMRAYLLTEQPDTHIVDDRYGLGTPAISSKPYFEQNEVFTNSGSYYESDRKSTRLNSSHA